MGKQLPPPDLPHPKIKECAYETNLSCLLFDVCRLRSGAAGSSWTNEIFVHDSVDALAPRDEMGGCTKGPRCMPTDFEPRYHRRSVYYFKGDTTNCSTIRLMSRALQTDLRRLGYYCGPIDGVFSDEVSDAIARLQKNYSMRVTGTLTDPRVRASAFAR